LLPNITVGPEREGLFVYANGLVLMKGGACKLVAADYAPGRKGLEETYGLTLEIVESGYFFYSSA